MQIDCADIPNQQQKSEQIKVDQTLIVPHRHLSKMYLLSNRPQYQRSCGMSAIITVFNYQFSRLGLGNLNPITVEEAYLKLNVIGTGSKIQSKAENKIGGIQSSNLPLEQYMNKLDFGYFTYSQTILKWYRLLCRSYKVRGRCYFFYKKSGKNKTELQGDNVLKSLISKLASESTQFIYRCYDHYFCPVGYEIVGKNDYDPFQNKSISQILKDSDITILVAETAKRFSPFHVIKWSDIQLDLSTCYPKFYDVRNLDRGVWTKKGAENQQQGCCYHCIMAFQKY